MLLTNSNSKPVSTGNVYSRRVISTDSPNRWGAPVRQWKLSREYPIGNGQSGEQEE